ncbi:amidohydrolase family protein [Litorimonas sp. WD9-15]|uniref:amidohydrolase family protein n=1 Tax=Litorimonas sp. WD9-15 TaxID=3418716 RepID=UPI003CFD455F
MTLKTALLSTIALTAASAIALTAFADSKPDDAKEDAKWDVQNPPGDKRKIDINVDEGTWMSLDVSPDGKTIAFDLLGDIYTMPATGGTAKNIASGMAWDMQPRFSPDGKEIAFTSDRAGGDNIWVMDVDGENARQITKETFRLMNNPTWSPDGTYIAAKKHFTTSRSLGTGEIWLYHTKGGSGVQLVKKPSETHQKELGEPIFAPDGKSIYYTQNTTPGGQFIYAQNSHTELFQIKEYDLETGEISTAAGGYGGAVRGAPSPDGKSLAFVKRVEARSKLFLKDLESGEERMIFDDLDQDMQETWAVQGVYPNMDWSPDGESIYFWAKGKIHKLNVTSGNFKAIPFKVRDTRTVMDAPRPKVDVAPDEFSIQMPRFVQMSPDGKSVVFESLGKLYIRDMANGRVKGLTKLPKEVRELYPSWSRDGKSVAFTTWTDADLGAIHTINVATGKITTHTDKPGHYKRPRLSPSGDFLTYEKGGGSSLTAPTYTDDPGLYVQAIGDNDPIRISKSGSDPHFDGDDLRVFFTKNIDSKSTLVSTNLLGDDQREHASSKMAQTYLISPNGDYVAFRENYNLFVMPLLMGPQNVGTGMTTGELPVVKVSEGGATYPSWSKDGTLNWSLGPNVFSATIDEMMSDDFEPVTDGTSISYKVKKDVPDTTVLLQNARLVTMADKDGGVMEETDIKIEGDRIVEIGQNLKRPSGNGVVIDLEGKTVVPGFIDAHAHGPQGTDELIPQQNWEAVATLALGVTTVFDPSSRASEIFAAGEMQRAGMLLAPRTYSTGEVIYGAKAPGFFANIQSEDDAREHVSRLKEQGAHGVKNYNQPRRDQRQQVVKAAHDENLIVVAEGGSLYHMDMSLVQDGNTSVEHNLPQEFIYDDVVQMYSQTNVAYTPTLAVTYGGVRGEAYYYAREDVWKHPILSAHTPPALLRSQSVRRETAPDADYADAASAAVSKKLLEAGVPVSIGAHGQREGLAAHWEMWSFSRGGMSPVQALMTATTEPARHLGFADDIGSLEEGKLADLVILSDNPLDDIRNTDKIEHVMIGGRLYEAATMNEVFTGDKERLPYYWEK